MTDIPIRVSYTAKPKNRPEHTSAEPQAFSSDSGMITFSRVDDDEFHRKHQAVVCDAQRLKVANPNA